MFKRALVGFAADRAGRDAAVQGEPLARLGGAVALAHAAVAIATER